MSDILTWPQQLSTAGTAGSGRFELGHEPYFIVEVDGKKIINQKAREAHGYTIATGAPSYEASVYRADVEGGIGIVPTLNLYLTGYEAALLARQEFKRRAPVVFRAGYSDVSGPYRERVLFKGEVVKAKQRPAFPIEVSIRCEGMSGRMNERYAPDVPETISNPMDFISSRLGNRGLSTNFLATPTNVSTDNVQVDALANPQPTLLDYLNAFCEAHGLYWLDNGGGTILFFFPQNRFNYLDTPPINWELRQRGVLTEPDIAAPLQQWDIEVLFAETPSTVSFLWVKPNGKISDKKLVEKPIPGGNPDLPGLVIPIVAKTQGQVDELAKAYIDDRLWQTIKGPWSTGSIGVPALTFDYIMATNGPVGMTEIYNRNMVVTRYHHIFDERGWSSKGNVRGVMA